MNKEQKAAVIDEVAGQIKESEAIFAVDYRGISVTQAADLRTRLDEAGARFRVVKNRLTQRAADQAGAESLKDFLEGPTAFTFVGAEGGDVALAAKALAQFRRETELLEFKGGTMGGELLSIEEIQSIARLPAREVLHAQLVGMVASRVTGLVRGLNQLIAGLAVQLGQIAEQGLVGQGATEPEPAAEPQGPEPPEESEPSAEASAEESAEEPSPEPSETPSEAPGDPVAEGEAAEESHQAEAPSEGDETEKEG